MAGTKEGGKLAAKRIKELYGEDFYAYIGSVGGKLGHTGGFASSITCHCPVIAGSHYIRNCAGAKGGVVSRRTK